MPTKIRLKGHNNSIALRDSIGNVVAEINESEAERWVIFSRVDSGKIAVQAGNVAAIFEAPDGS